MDRSAVENLAVDTPAIADFPDEMDRLAEWRGRRTLDELVEEIRAVAREHGYALAVHGSRRRDLDLLAVPWVDEVSGPDALVGALEAALDLVKIRGPKEKPHGRRGYILCGRRWREDLEGLPEHQPIDLSVVPPT